MTATMLQFPTTRPAHLIRIAVPRLNKNETIGEYLRQIPTRDYDLNWAEVTESRTLNAHDWNELVSNLLNDRDWLAGKGGAGNWNPDYAGMSHQDICNLGKAGMNHWRETVYLLVIAVTCETTGQTIYIDPEGYNYARYVAFAATPDMADGTTPAERKKAEETAAVAARKAAIAHHVANPPVVPADHGLRFYWNGIKANGGALQGAQYGLGGLYDWPADTLSISARKYTALSPEVKAVFRVTNESDPWTDYHDYDRVRVCPNHPLYAEVMAAYRKQEQHMAARKAKRGW